MTQLKTQAQIIELTDDQLEAAQGGCGHQLEPVGANETCRQVGDPRTGVYQLICEQYKN